MPTTWKNVSGLIVAGVWGWLLLSHDLPLLAFPVAVVGFCLTWGILSWITPPSH